MKEKILLNIVTAASRLRNLPYIEENLKILDPYFRVKWIVILDDYFIKPNQIDIKPNVLISITPDRTLGPGADQKNVASDFISEGWVYYLDDDNLIHPQFPQTAYNYINQCKNKCIVFNQSDLYNQHRLNTFKIKKISYSQIDTASFLIHSSLIKESF